MLKSILPDKDVQHYSKEKRFWQSPSNSPNLGESYQWGIDKLEY